MFEQLLVNGVNLGIALGANPTSNPTPYLVLNVQNH